MPLQFQHSLSYLPQREDSFLVTRLEQSITYKLKTMLPFQKQYSHTKYGRLGIQVSQQLTSYSQCNCEISLKSLPFC